MRHFIDVTQPGYDACSDGTQDAAPVIQRAINDLSQSRGSAFGRSISGGIVFLPAGVYLLDSPIVLDNGIKLMGAGWTNSEFVGTWCAVSRTSWNGQSFTPITMRSGVLEDIAFYHHYTSEELPKPGADWQPKDYGWTVSGEGDEVHLKNILMRNAKRGARLRGRFTVSGFWAHPLHRPLEIENTAANDVCHVDNVHLWSFWDGNNEEIETYTLKNAIGVVCNGADNPLFSNIFVQRCYMAFYFGNSQRKTSRFHLSNIEIDSCSHAIFVDAAHTEGQVCNLIATGTTNDKKPFGRIAGLNIAANNVSIQCSNIEFGTYGKNCIDVAGEGSKVWISGLICRNWSLEAKGFHAAVLARDGGEVRIARATSEFSDGPRNSGKVFFE